MYELIILGFLMQSPMHGYKIAKIINDMIGPFAKVSNGRLYPLLTKLEADGLIAAVEDTDGSQRGDRRQRAFKITDAGRVRFHQIMMDTTSNPGEYQRIFWHKLQFLDFLPLAERTYLLDHYINYSQTHIFHITNEMEEFKREFAAKRFMNTEQAEAVLYAMQHMLKHWELDRNNALSWRARIVANAEAAPALEISEQTPGMKKLV